MEYWRNGVLECWSNGNSAIRNPKSLAQSDWNLIFYPALIVISFQMSSTKPTKSHQGGPQSFSFHQFYLLAIFQKAHTGHCNDVTGLDAFGHNHVIVPDTAGFYRCFLDG